MIYFLSILIIDINLPYLPNLFFSLLHTEQTGVVSPPMSVFWQSVGPELIPIKKWMRSLIHWKICIYLQSSLWSAKTSNGRLSTLFYSLANYMYTLLGFGSCWQVKNSVPESNQECGFDFPRVIFFIRIFSS